MIEITSRGRVDKGPAKQGDFKLSGGTFRPRGTVFATRKSIFFFIQANIAFVMRTPPELSIGLWKKRAAKYGRTLLLKTYKEHEADLRSYFLVEITKVKKRALREVKFP